MQIFAWDQIKVIANKLVELLLDVLHPVKEGLAQMIQQPISLASV